MNNIAKNLPFVNTKVLPSGHRFFLDCKRETFARWIEWGMWSGHPQATVWFATMTFKAFIPAWRSYLLIKKFLGHLNDGYRDKADKGGFQLRWILATEWQVRNVIHYHLLISAQGLDFLSRKRWERRWECIDRNAGFCRIYDADRKAAPYLAKYLNKSGCELNWGGNWQGLNSPGSLDCCHRPGVDKSVESINVFRMVL